MRHPGMSRLKKVYWNILSTWAIEKHSLERHCNDKGCRVESEYRIVMYYALQY